MTVDRWGKKVLVAWSEIEMEWLMAAISLDPCDRVPAYRDIGDMVGRTLEAVRRRANDLIKELAILEQEAIVPPPVPIPVPSFEPIKQLTKKQMMGRR